ncbi:MAG: hypothetical protein ACLSXD_07925 [Lawsonibacter sp.]
MSKEYNIGIYIRLSMADEDAGYGSKAESDSIGNQRMLINRFLDNHPELSHCQRSSLRMTVIPARTFTVLSSRR